MPRRNFNDGQEITFGDLNAIGAAGEKNLFDRVLYELVQRTTNAVFSDSFLVEYVSANTVSMRPGVGFMLDATQVSPEPTKRQLYLAASTNLVTAGANASLDRIDLVCIQAARQTEISETRKYKDPTTSVISTQTMVTETYWQINTQVVTGTPGVSPSAPAVPSGWIAAASLYVHAVSGLSGAGDVTDLRVPMPVGGKITLNTTGFNRLPASSTQTLDSIVASIDTQLRYPATTYDDADDLTGTGSQLEPTTPASGKRRFFSLGGVDYVKDATGAKTPIGSGGGGSALNWNAPAGLAPVLDEENYERVFLYTSGLTQKLTVFLKVPQTYVSGRQIKMYLGLYSPSSSGTILLQSTSYLIRHDNDAVTSTTNSYPSTNAALTNTVANQYRQTMLDLTDTTGKVNSFAVSPGDMLRVDLVRGTDTDTADLRFVPSSTELKLT